jgi:hypothetical protein
MTDTAPTTGMDLIADGDPRYEDARTLHSALIDRRPAVIEHAWERG